MARADDPCACPVCRSSRTRAVDLIYAAGTRHSKGSTRKRALGARGWWLASCTDWRANSQTVLAARCDENVAVSPSAVAISVILAVVIFGWQVTAVLGALLVAIAVVRDVGGQPQNDFLCLRCGHRFLPNVARRAVARGRYQSQ